MTKTPFVNPQIRCKMQQIRPGMNVKKDDQIRSLRQQIPQNPNLEMPQR